LCKATKENAVRSFPAVVRDPAPPWTAAQAVAAVWRISTEVKQKWMIAWSVANSPNFPSTSITAVRAAMPIGSYGVVVTTPSGDSGSGSITGRRE
jgi:hypothetical protein